VRISIEGSLVRQTQQLAIGHTANEAVLKISQVLEAMWIKAPSSSRRKAN
jgi:hypothetical protein